MTADEMKRHQEEGFQFLQNLYIVEDHIEDLMNIIKKDYKTMEPYPEEVKHYFHLLAKRIDLLYNEHIKNKNNLNDPSRTTESN